MKTDQGGKREANDGRVTEEGGTREEQDEGRVIQEWRRMMEDFRGGWYMSGRGLS